MGKFSDYVGTIKNQTDSLREVVSAKSGVDCSKYSIGECAGVVEDLEVTSQDEARYVRPSWYPDIEDIVMNAPDITVDGVTYYPLYIMLMKDNEVSSPFYKLTATTSGAINYLRGTGGEAYIFSDVVNNDISNANETTLTIGTELIHTWDASKDIGTGEYGYKIRWFITYTNSLSGNKGFSYLGGTDLLELVVRQGIYSHLMGMSAAANATKINYIKVCKDVKTKEGSQYVFSRLLVKEIVNDGELLLGGYSLSYLYSLKRFVNNGYVYFSISSSYPFSYNYSIKKFKIDSNFILPERNGNAYSLITPYSLEHLIIDNSSIINYFAEFYNLKKLELINTESISSDAFFANCYSLDYVKIPSTLKSWAGTSSTTLNYCTYVELFNDFDISGVNLTGHSANPKTVKWLKDLCIWLKDRTGEEANTMIIGTANLTNASNIYLTFNQNDKRDITFDGVTAETEGAMSITEFITTQLNWTLS